MQDAETLFPLPRLKSSVPDNVIGGLMELQITCHAVDAPYSVKMMISKGAPLVRGYTPPKNTVPLYDFCELQALLLREVDDLPLIDLQFRAPEGPLAKKFLKCFRHMVQSNSKLKKRKMREFRRDSACRAYIMHLLITSDGMDMCLRAKNVYDNMYTLVSAVEGDETFPWDRRSYDDIVAAIMTMNV